MSSVSLHRAGASKPPKYCRQKEKNRPDRACVKINGKKIMLGRYGSPESRAKYNELVAGPATLVDEETITVAQVMVAYLEHAIVYYAQPDGKPGREFEQIREVLRRVRHCSSSIPATQFGPKRLKEVRQSLIDDGLSRRHINNQIDRVKRMFKWAAGEELIPGNVYVDLSIVGGLKKGRSKARETSPILPVSDADVKATISHLPQVVADMVKLQRYTGMRPGELTQMRPCDIDRSRDVWFYQPASHKTAHYGRGRVVAIGPNAQEVLISYLDRGSQEYCFRPIDSESIRRRVASKERCVPLSCGNKSGSNRQASPKRKPGGKYDTSSYRKAIQRAAKRAGVPKWSPHQLRHSAATEVRKVFGLEAAQVVLGHAQASITEVYAERDLAKAAEVALKIG